MRDQYENLKNNILEEFKNNYFEWMAFHDVESDKNYNTFMNSFNLYVKNKQWNNFTGDNIPLVVAKILQINIIKFNVENDNYTIQFISNETSHIQTRNIHIKFANNHYEPIVRTNR